MKVLPSHAVDDNVREASLEVRLHWRIIGNHCLMFGGTHSHATHVRHVAKNARENACLMFNETSYICIIEETRKDGYCLADAFNYILITTITAIL